MALLPRYVLALSMVLASTTALLADTTIKVSLWDKGPAAMMMDDTHMKMMGKMDMSMMNMGTMGVTLDQTTVPAGKVTFAAINDSKATIHEMLVAPVPVGATELPFVADENRVDEEAAHYLGEVSELEPGKSGELTVDLAPGTYVVFCNVPGHFISGMWTLLTVIPPAP